MENYKALLRHILEKGDDRMDRTGVGTRAVFGTNLRFNLNDGFPAVTSKKLAWKAVVSELLWFIEGSGDERRLCEILYGNRDSSNITIWTDNANSDYWKMHSTYDGDCGRIYGVQWRGFQGKDKTVDQLQVLIDGIKKDPYGRRHILSAWNPTELDQTALPPCHVMCQFFVSSNQLSCQMYQRSVDSFLGLPFNIASYSLLTHIIATECNLDVGEFIWVGGDTHIYFNHFDAVNKLLNNDCRSLPTLRKFEKKPFDQYVVDDFVLDGYDPHPPIKATMAV